MPSFISSVGSRSSTGGRNPNLHLHLPNTRNCFPQEESSKASLHSSWIRRLRLRPLPSSAAPPHFHAPALLQASSLPPSGAADDLDPAHRKTISTGESRTGASSSTLRSSFFRRLLYFCRERPELDGDDDDESRPFVGFGPFRVATRKRLLRPASAVAPTPAKPALPWVSPPDVKTDSLEQDPDWNDSGIGGFGLVRKDSVEVLDASSDWNRWNLRKEEEESRKIGLPGGIVNSRIHGNTNFANLGGGSSSFRQRSVPAVGASPSFKFSLPLLNDRENLRRSIANSFVRSTRDEGTSGEFVEETMKRFMDCEHSWLSGNESGCSPLQRLPPFGLHQRVSKRHLYGDPSLGAAGNTNGANYISRATRGGGGQHEMVDHGAFLDPHLIHHNAVPQKPVCPSEPDEAFSYWNLGRYKRAKTTTSAIPDSSAFPAFSMNRNSAQEMNLNMDEFRSVNSRKLGTEE